MGAEQSSEGHAYQDELPTNPTGSTLASAESGQTVEIHNETINRNAAGAAAAGGVSKPLMYGVGAMVLGSAGLGIFNFLTVPGLNAQIEELESEIDRLETEVDRLEEQNDVFEGLNRELNSSLMDLEAINSDLNESTTLLEITVNALNVTVQDLNNTRNGFVEENERLAMLGVSLNATSQALANEIDELQAAERNFQTLNAGLQEVESNLMSEIEALNETETTLRAEANSLNTTMMEIASEVVQLNDTIQQLSTVNEFLGAFPAEINQIFADFSGFLEAQIDSERLDTLLGLQNLFNDAGIGWQCRFEAQNSQQPYIMNPFLPIGDDFDVVMDAVEARYLNVLCLDRADFVAYIDSRFSRETFSVSRLYSAIANYGGDAQDYYFPTTGQTGLSAADWEAADYDCNNVVPYRAMLGSRNM